MKKFPILSKIKSLNDSYATLLRSYTQLFSFEGTSSTVVAVSGSKDIDKYRLLQFDLFDTNGNIVASQTVSALVARGNTVHFIYGNASNMWASYQFVEASKNITLNRTSATTSKLRCFGID